MLMLESAFPTLRNVTEREAPQLNKVSIPPKRSISGTPNLVCSNRHTDSPSLPPHRPSRTDTLFPSEGREHQNVLLKTEIMV